MTATTTAAHLAATHKDTATDQMCAQLHIEVPATRDSFVVTDEFETLRAVVSQRLGSGATDRTLMLGPAGCGKTTTAEQLAAHLEMPYLHINCSSIREAGQLFGTREVADGKTFTRESLFTRAVTNGNCVVMLDEINRCAPAALNGLLSVLDGSKVWIEELQKSIQVGPNVVFIGACNVGSAYSGTFRLDKALDDRFDRRIEVSYLPAPQEAELLVNSTGISKIAAERLVRIAEQVRNDFNAGKTFSSDVSTRVLLAAAGDFAVMESIRPGSGPLTLKLTIANRFSGGDKEAGSERSSLAMLLDGQFGNWNEKSARAAV